MPAMRDNMKAYLISMIAIIVLLSCKAAEQPSFIDPATGMEFVKVSGGCYQMGDTFGDGELDERPVHKVCVGDFDLGKFEVTQKQWRDVMGENPSEFSQCGGDCPVENVSWDDAQDFIAAINRKYGVRYRLPTEAEWEYAARSGGRRDRYSGTSKEAAVEDYAWVASNSEGHTHPVGAKKPNGLGLYDMSGNVWEWTGDCYDDGYYQHSPVDNPAGPPTCLRRVFRGGSWFRYPADVRASLRSNYAPDVRRSSFGLRMLRMK